MLRPGAVIEKEGYDKLLEERQISEFVTEVPATDYGSKKVDAITHALKTGSQKESCIEKLVKAAGCTLVKPYGIIIENSGRAVTISQLINHFGINTTASLRCNKCHETFTWDTILYHLEGSYKSGHNMKLKDITKLFSDKWYNWIWRDNEFIK